MLSAGGDYIAVRYPPGAKTKFDAVVIKPPGVTLRSDAALFPNYFGQTCYLIDLSNIETDLYEIR